MKIFARATAFLFGLFLILQLLLLPAWAQGKTRPIELIEQTVNSVIDTLKDKELCRKERRDRVLGFMYRRFDFEEMSRRILATNWPKLTREQRKRFEDLFSRLLGISYYKKMEGYTDEKVVFKRQIIRGRYALVETVVKAHDKDIPINYKLIYKKGDWHVYDVRIEGVSLVSNYRTSYNSIIRKEGVDALLRTMEEKVEKLEREYAGTRKRPGEAA